MKRNFALVMLVVVLLIALFPVVVFAAEAAGVEFNPENLIVGGVALAPLISIIISVLKGWIKIDTKYIPLINVVLGTVAVLVVGVINEGMPLVNAIIMTLGVVLGSQVFHETFGHALKAIGDIFEKKTELEE
ncbi:MAG: hypothetical protein QM401_04975 [Bacillota bacterium]|nr:hypothetical protein [Bacillota bacterium]